MPDALEPYIGIGDEDEAVSYVADGLKVWMNTEAALDWMKSLLL